jgi:hypothetical protein
MTTVTKSNILTTTYDLVFGILNTNVQSVTPAAGGTVSLVAWSTGNYWTGAFPDFDIDSKSSYPCAVLHTVTSNESPETYRATGNTVELKMEILTLSGQQSALFAEKIKKIMEDNLSVLNIAGLYQKKMPQMVSKFGVREKSNIRVHDMQVIYTFDFLAER